MNEYRRARRRQMAESVSVVDCMTEQVIGRIGNLSETGMLMMANGGGVDDGLFQLRFQLPMGRGVVHSLSVGAHQLWAEANAGAGCFWTGFRFIDISQADAEHLRAWIDEPGSAYA